MREIKHIIQRALGQASKVRSSFVETSPEMLLVVNDQTNSTYNESQVDEILSTGTFGTVDVMDLEMLSSVAGHDVSCLI